MSFESWQKHWTQLNWQAQGCFCKLGVPFVGVLVVRALQFGVYIRGPLMFRKLQYYTKRELRRSLQVKTIQGLKCQQPTRKQLRDEYQLTETACMLSLALLLENGELTWETRKTCKRAGCMLVTTWPPRTIMANIAPNLKVSHACQATLEDPTTTRSDPLPSFRTLPLQRASLRRDLISTL